ncbi:MAG TPA: hypothetical protein VHM24_02780 [Gemmatimonadaceae bacterium]|nr:hypothetical protein [Gemmatimonadaceae bacterium]
MNRFPVPPRLAAIGLLIVTAAFIPGRTEALEDYASPRNATVDARGARSVVIDAEAGILRVDGRSGINEVRVRGTARANRESLLRDIKLIAERRGDVVFIKADIEHDDGFWGRANDDRYRGLDLIIEVPVNLKLDVKDGSGEAEFANTGAIDLEDGSGSIEIRGAHGDVRIHDGSGSITIDGVEGTVRVSDGSGEIRATNVTRDFIVETDGSGSIDVRGVGGTMRVESDGSGNIDVERVAGDFVVENAGSGSISYETVKGTVRIPDRKRRGY